MEGKKEKGRKRQRKHTASEVGSVQLDPDLLRCAPEQFPAPEDTASEGFSRLTFPREKQKSERKKKKKKKKDKLLQSPAAKKIRETLPDPDEAYADVKKKKKKKKKKRYVSNARFFFLFLSGYMHCPSKWQ